MFAVLGAFALAGARSATADWSHDPNVNTPVGVGDFSETDPVSAPDGSGGVYIAWIEHGPGLTVLAAQHFNAAGIPLWEVGGVISDEEHDIGSPVVVSDGSGGAYFAWLDEELSGLPVTINVQHVNAARQLWPVLGGIVVSPYIPGSLSPAMVADGNGGVFVAWRDQRNGTGYDIYAQHVSAAGALLWSPGGLPVCTAANDQTDLCMVADGSGGALFAWADLRSGAYFEFYAQRLDAAGVPQWTTNGVPAYSAPIQKAGPSLVADGTGGAIIAWADLRNGLDYDLYAQRLNAAGAAQWTANGVALCTATHNQGPAMVVADGAGGAIFAWQDLRVDADIYAQRVSGLGTVQWTANGVALSTAFGNQQSPAIASDGAGGAIITWRDHRSSPFSVDLYAQRVNPAGIPLWTYDGAAICTAAYDQFAQCVVSDGSGGAVIAWQDARSNTSYDIYAQRIDQFGYLGSTEPASTGVRDIPNDQGGKVKVSWSASYLDAQPYGAIDSYWILRAAPPNVVAEARARGARITTDLSAEPRPGVRTFIALPGRAADNTWEFVASEPAFHVANYSYVASTTSDSVGAGNPRTAFMIMALAYGGAQYWYSLPDSGYSVDNLPPAQPAPFTGAYGSGATHLHWGRNHESDLAGYRLYRGSSSGFVPGPGNLISAQPDTGYGDPGPAGRWYKLSAIDVHGNESVYAILGPNGTLDAPDPAVTRLALAPPAPNPSTGESATFGFSLPIEAHASLVIFDEQGRRVRELVNGTLPAGQHRPRWDGRDDAGHSLPSGIYFIRLQAMGRSIQARFVRLR